VQARAEARRPVTKRLPQGADDARQMRATAPGRHEAHEGSSSKVASPTASRWLIIK
jgi:hypothetical protein